ncbi:hypothetical protein A2856_00225 [Candidatus Uhrbacteria bacterium RIFCSPHIGHO2_01_FULL_63_20]|uniref:O-antigen ligase-related domain-containing protein n=1 Tax=Candidatus Uhrbacteria bacterium RIFCSPHIGHO2_01_FULL_63_20 TaxID=1802385 RepID=A0A1F7TLS3_9BACT|nr:MAG: hypothetical protein A2856_00225 [Candidatus Uhrbacteria bacterium RIFCSPHIGHO2_01_FULL_63_20]
MNRERLGQYALLLALFLLPWQLREIFTSVRVDGQMWEYGTGSLYATQLLVLLAVILRGGFRIDRARAFVGPVAIVVLAAIVSAATSPVPMSSLALVFQVGLAAMLFLGLLDVRTDPTRAAAAFVLGLVPSALLGWAQVWWGETTAYSWLGLASHSFSTLGDSVVETAEGLRTLRAYGPLPHPNILGGYLAAGLLTLAMLASRWRAQAKRTWLALPVIVLVAGLVATFSRGAWVAATLAFLAVVAGMLWIHRMAAHVALPLVYAGLFALILTVFTFHSQVFTRFAPGARLEARSLSERSAAYREAPAVFLLRPILGVGPALYTAALAELRPGAPVYAYQPVHNAFVLFLAEMGLLGTLAAVPFIRRLIVAVRAINVRSERVFSLAGLVLLVTLAMFDHYLWSLWSGLSLTAVVAAFAVRGGKA